MAVGHRVLRDPGPDRDRMAPDERGEVAVRRPGPRGDLGDRPRELLPARRELLRLSRELRLRPDRRDPLREAPGPRADRLTPPGLDDGDLLVHPQPAGSKMRALGRERAVAERGVVAGQGEIPEGVLEPLVDLLERLLLTELGSELLPPGLGRRTRHDVLDGELRGVDGLFALVGLLDPLQHELALVAPSVEIEGDRREASGDLLVGGEVLPACGEVAVHGGRDVLLVLHLGRRGEQGAVDVRRRPPDEEPPHQEGLDGEHRGADLGRGRRPTITAVHQVQEQRIDRRRPPGLQPGEPRTHMRVLLTLRVQDDGEQVTEAPKPCDLLDQLVLVPELLETLHLVGVDGGLSGLRVVLDQVEPEQQLQLLGRQRLLQREPEVCVRLLRLAVQAHEEMVPQQVSLGELETRVVQRLEDPVDVVVLLRGDGDEGQAQQHRLLQSLDVHRCVLVRRGGEPPGEVPVRLADPVGAAGAAGLADAGAVGVAIRLGRGELETGTLLLPLVLQVLLIDPVPVLRSLRGGAMVAQRREQDRERRETLLAVDDQVPVHARRPVRG